MATSGKTNTNKSTRVSGAKGAGSGLKDNKAGYSTTNRFGQTTYYKSAKDASGYSDTRDGKNVATSPGKALVTKDATGNVITSDALKKGPQINLVTTPLNTSVPDITANNQGLTSKEYGVTASGNGVSVTPPTNDIYAGMDANQKKFQAELEKLNPPSGADIQRKLERQTQYEQKQQDVNNLSGQLNTIVANRDANLLRVEGQGRGIPEAIIGGQQAQIQKEAAIAALPVQAQLAQAQGNLALAQDHINTWGKILMEDATNQYNRDRSVLTSAYEYAQGIEKSRIQDLQAEKAQKYQEQQNLTKAKTSALSNALGQGAPASVVSAIKLATTPEEVATATGIYNGDILGRKAQQASIDASYTSIAKNKAELAVIQAKQKQIEDAVSSGRVVLDEEQQKTSMALSKQFEDESKNFKIQANAYNQIIASAQDSSAAGDLSLIFGYMKMLDPNSVVRETEFANAENAGGIPERVRAQWNKAKQGERLTESMRTDFVDRAAKIYGSALDQQVDLEDTFSKQGTDVYGLPKQAVDLIIRDIRAQGAVSDVAFGLTLNNLSDSQLIDLRQSGLLTTPSGI